MGGIILVFTVAGSALGGLLKENFFIVTTSYLGSFLVLRGIGSLMNNYPNVLKETVQPFYYIYIGLILLHTVLGVVVQSILKKKFAAKDDSSEFINNPVLEQPLNPEGGDANVDANVEVNVDVTDNKDGEGVVNKEGEQGGEVDGKKPEGEGDADVKLDGDVPAPEGDAPVPEGEGDTPAE